MVSELSQVLEQLPNEILLVKKTVYTLAIGWLVVLIEVVLPQASGAQASSFI